MKIFQETLLPVCAPCGEPSGRFRGRVQQERPRMRSDEEGLSERPSKMLLPRSAFLGLFHCTLCCSLGFLREPFKNVLADFVL